MFWLGLCIGLLVSAVEAGILEWKYGKMAKLCKELDLEIMRERRREAALRVIAENERQASR